MKPKLSRFAIPYVIWMALFVVAPIVLVVVYAFSSADGGFTLENFAHMEDYAVVFSRSFQLALIATLLVFGSPVVLGVLCALFAVVVCWYVVILCVGVVAVALLIAMVALVITESCAFRQTLGWGRRCWAAVWCAEE